MSLGDLVALRVCVHADSDLALRLHRIEPERFADDVRAIAAELGFVLTEADLDAAIRQGRRAWALRWIL